MKLVALHQFARLAFAEGSAPHIHTLRRMVKEGVLHGRRLGSRYYVDAAMIEAGFDPIVAKVLNDVRRAS